MVKACVSYMLVATSCSPPCNHYCCLFPPVHLPVTAVCFLRCTYPLLQSVADKHTEGTTPIQDDECACHRSDNMQFGWKVSVGRAASMFSFILKKEAAVSTEVLVPPFKRHRVTSHKTWFVLCTAVKKLYTFLCNDYTISCLLPANCTS